MYFPPETRVTPLLTIKRERLLPVRGEVLVRVGEWVEAIDVVARTRLPGGVRVLDAGHALRLPPERVGKALRKQVGDSVQANEIVAASGLLFRRTCRAPVAGTVLAVRGGMILLESEPKPFELRAHLRGQVVSVMPNFGVVISTAGALIQGVWGTGRETNGVLKVLVDSPKKPLRARNIDVSCHGTIIVGGAWADEKALLAAEEAQVRGLIVGSLDAALCAQARKLSFPVMVTEGMGTVPMSQPFFALLNTNDGREASLSTATQTRWGALRPEVIIPLRAEGQQADNGQPGGALQPGARVRVVREPYMAQTGRVVRLPPLAQSVESGLRLQVAEVEIEGAGVVAVPLSNVELIR